MRVIRKARARMSQRKELLFSNLLEGTGEDENENDGKFCLTLGELGEYCRIA